jgi:hypothetical protein
MIKHTKNDRVRRSYRGNGRGPSCVILPLVKLLRAIAQCAGNKHVRGAEQRLATEAVHSTFLEDNRVLGSDVTCCKRVVVFLGLKTISTSQHLGGPDVNNPKLAIRNEQSQKVTKIGNYQPR